MGRFWVPDALWATAVSPTAKLLYALFCRSMRSGSEQDHPWDYSHAQLGECLGVKERSIRLALVELKAVGMAGWRRSKKGIGRRRVNVYEAFPVEHWAPQAFRPDTRHVVPGLDLDTRQLRARHPAADGPDTRHVVPTPGITTPGITTPGSKEAPRTVVRGPVSASPSRVSTSSQDPVGSFDRFWASIPKRISVGTAVVEAFKAWRALPPEFREAVRLKVVEFLADGDASALYDHDGSVLVTPADLIELGQRAAVERKALVDVLEALA